MAGLTPVFSKHFTIKTLTPQTAIFGILDFVCNDSFLRKQ